MPQALTGTFARVLYGLPFVVFGTFHFLVGDKMANMVPAWLPGGAFWVYLTGAALLAAGISAVSGRLTRLAMPLLAAMLALFILTVHLPWMTVPELSQMAVPNLLKDLALAGAALRFAAPAPKRRR